MTDEGASLLLRNIGRLVTNREGSADLLGEITGAAVLIDSGVVAWVGRDVDLPADAGEVAELDCAGAAVLPGFVDAHSHVVFAGDRADEFGRRLRGEAYEEILAAGGGIQSTVTATRSASFDDLYEQSTARVRAMIEHGTTTLEVKSGYGLEVDTERRILEVANAIGERLPIDIVTTFLGAHVVPAEFADRREDYVRLVIDEMLPAAAPLASGCDVFCDVGAFTVREADRILRAASTFGLDLRIHADQLERTGAAALAADLGARSADHLDHATDEDLDRLAASGTVAVFLPGVALSMGQPQIDATSAWDRGVRVALATDCNPGTGYIVSMPFVMALAALEMGLSMERVVWAATLGGALALGAADRGRLVPGSTADLVVLDAESYLAIPYRPDVNPVRTVVKDGVVVA